MVVVPASFQSRGTSALGTRMWLCCQNSGRTKTRSYCASTSTRKVCRSSLRHQLHTTKTACALCRGPLSLQAPTQSWGQNMATALYPPTSPTYRCTASISHNSAQNLRYSSSCFKGLRAGIQQHCLSATSTRDDTTEMKWEPHSTARSYSRRCPVSPTSIVGDQETPTLRNLPGTAPPATAFVSITPLQQ